MFIVTFVFIFKALASELLELFEKKCQEEGRNVTPTWLTSVDIWWRQQCCFSPWSISYVDVYRCESCRCCTLPFLTYFLSFHLSRFSSYINTGTVWEFNCDCVVVFLNRHPRAVVHKLNLNNFVTVKFSKYWHLPAIGDSLLLFVWCSVINFFHLSKNII